jgi:energy-coupling factor transporter ATP-binding protein EcfA2
MAVISSITLENISVFKERVKFDLAPLTVIAGKNSSGKTTILNVITLLRESIIHRDVIPGNEQRGILRSLLFISENHPFRSFDSMVSRGSGQGHITIGVGLKGVEFKAGSILVPYLDQWKKNTDLIDSPILTSVEGGKTFCFEDEVIVYITYYQNMIATVSISAAIDKGYVRLADFNYSYERKSTDNLIHPEVTGKVFPFRILRSLGVEKQRFTNEIDGFVDGSESGDPYLNDIIHVDHAGYSEAGIELVGNTSLGTINRYERDINRDMGYIIFEPSIYAIVKSLTQSIGKVDRIRREHPYEDSLFELKKYYGFASDIPTDVMYLSDLAESTRSGDMTSLNRLSKHCKEYGIAENVHLDIVDEGKRTGAVRFSIALDRDEGLVPLTGIGSGHLRLFSFLINLLGPSFTGHARFSALLIEEPEANLHPYMQSRVADLFINILPSIRRSRTSIFNHLQDKESEWQKSFDDARGVNAFHNPVILETHSHVLIKRMQYRVAMSQELENEIIVYFINSSKDGNQKVYKITMDSNGRLSEPFPPGFVDHITTLSLKYKEVKRDN